MLQIFMEHEKHETYFRVIPPTDIDIYSDSDIKFDIYSGIYTGDPASSRFAILSDIKCLNIFPMNWQILFQKEN